jgi:hypothetical protein
MIFDFSLFFGDNLFDTLTTNENSEIRSNQEKLGIELYLPRLTVHSKVTSPWEEDDSRTTEFLAVTGFYSYYNSTVGLLNVSVRILGFGVGFSWYKDSI